MQTHSSNPSTGMAGYEIYASPSRPQHSFNTLASPPLGPTQISQLQQQLQQQQQQQQSQQQQQQQSQQQQQQQSQSQQGSLTIVSGALPIHPAPKPEGMWDVLDLSGVGLRVLSSTLSIYAQLTVLIASNNQLSWLPEAFYDWLPNLTHLDLAANLLQSLPPGIRKLRDLETLHLQNNRLVSIPWDMGKLRNISNIRIEGNMIANVPQEILLQPHPLTLIHYLRESAPDSLPHAPRKWLQISEGRKTSGKFRVMCYNILAEVLASPNLFFYCPSWALSFNYRKKKILEEILSQDPDIVCLQVVRSHRLSPQQQSHFSMRACQ
eukprot:TRINITY_DN2652_c0_g1_i7.p1 TRINITY_DN2652_c0_g1~~TRINITY_DN2652_c0_g1_i7.p1  ORF type:complete len:322 (+),score=88.07 TRINITY_DN2652_c0_g1_i7:130-1095(+)